MDDLLPKLSQARVFSVVDAKNGFWHVPLDTESSYLTTFATPWGRYRWKRMPFGISPAPEEFQRRLDNALEGLEGVVPIFDILVFGAGRTRDEAVLDHDKKLTTLLDRCRLKGIKLNKEKLKFRLDQVSFMGHTVTSEGLKPDPAKVEAIQRMPAPANKQDVRRLLGTVNYLQKFAPNLSDLTAPLRELLKEANSFQWSEQVEGQCFHQLKDVLSTPPVLKYFDPHQGLELQCDASEKGLGACLMQGGQPLAYASRSLTETEQQYAQIEKEMLAIFFGSERFKQYVYGRKVRVETDHKPLESILKKSLLSAPKRLQRMMLRLQKFDLEVTYKKGSELYLADTLSRAFLPERTKQEGSGEDILSVDNYRGDAEKEVESINMLHCLSVTEDTLNLIKQATEEDNRMKILKTTIRGGWPVTKDMVPEELQDFFPFRDELSLQDGLVFKGERLVIPSGIRHNIMARLHASHIGIQGCLCRARETVYWPGMNKEVTEYISKCEICCAYPQDQAKEPLISHEIPTRLWETIGCDMFEFGGRDYLITVDYFSNFFEVDQLSNKTNQEVTGKLKQHLARHGLPDQLISDNGPPYNSRAFQEFAIAYGFEHVTSSPGYPQSNGRVENAVKTAKNLMRKAVESKRDPYLSLLDWRNTPSEGLSSSPAQRLFSRRTRTLLPTASGLLKPEVTTNITQKLQLQKAKQALHFNANTKELTELKAGDKVRIKPLKPTENHKPWIKATVDSKADIRSYQVRTEGGRLLRHNRRHLRKTNETPDQAQIVLPPSLSSLPISTKPTESSVTTLPMQSEQSQISLEAPRESDTPRGSTKDADTPRDQLPPIESPKEGQPVATTRSGRAVRRPQYLQDYFVEKQSKEH